MRIKYCLQFICLTVFLSTNTNAQTNQITIGTQTWKTENLTVDALNNGTHIQFVKDTNQWNYMNKLKQPAWCYYNFDTSYSKYGKLYNWYVVQTKKVCPIGWHVPSENEWKVLTTFLKGDTSAGGKLKEPSLTYWAAPNAIDPDPTKRVGFKALPGGILFDNKFADNRTVAYWWSKDTVSAEMPEHAWFRYLAGNKRNFYGGGYINKKHGLSIRCIKD